MNVTNCRAIGKRRSSPNCGPNQLWIAALKLMQQACINGPRASSIRWVDLCSISWRISRSNSRFCLTPLVAGSLLSRIFAKCVRPLRSLLSMSAYNPRQAQRIRLPFDNLSPLVSARGRGVFMKLILIFSCMVVGSAALIPIDDAEARRSSRGKSVRVSAAGSSALGAYRNCAAARAAGAAPVYRGQPGYGPHLDRDNDGIGCEPYRGRR